MTNNTLVQQLYQSIGMDEHGFGHDAARLTIHGNKVVGLNLVPGLEMTSEETTDGVAVKMIVRQGVCIEHPVHVCFGVLPETGLQRIDMDVLVEDGAQIQVQAHCTFPNAVDVRHEMDARVRVGKNAVYQYFERHVHGQDGGVNVVPRTSIHVAEGGRFKTEFELIKGSVGSIDIDYEATCEAHSVVEMLSRISARGQDRIKIREAAHLVGEHARAALTSHIAVRGDSHADIENLLVATAPYARGHVDCKEIVMDRATAKAIPIVEVRNSKAHVTHEAAIGSVDSSQLQTLMAHGLDEDAASDLIIQGMLS
jgi:Fe-S cluster assembly scaffold protein SufB